MLIYTAVYGTPLGKLWIRQTAFLLFSLGAMTFFGRIPMRLHDGLAYVYYGVVLLALVLALLQPTEIKRWLSFGPVRFQPSEFAKLGVIFALGRWLRDHSRSINSVWTIAGALFLVALPSALVVREPDLGTALVFFVIAFAMLYAAGTRPLYLFLLLTPALAMVSALHWVAWAVYFALLLVVLFAWRVSPTVFLGAVVVAIAVGVTTPYVWAHLHPYQQERILVFLNPGHDPFGAGYQLIQSKIAIGSGGVFGKGFLEGTQIKLAFLPAKHSDFIFAVLGEQFGFVGCVLVLALFWLFIWRAVRIASQARTTFGSVVAMGIAAVVAFQVVVNVSMTVGLAPITGIPLPFLSSGGSALVTFWLMTGALQQIYSQRA